MLTKLIKLAERGLIPDFLIRNGIKQLCTARLKMEKKIGQDMIEEKNQYPHHNPMMFKKPERIFLNNITE